MTDKIVTREGEAATDRPACRDPRRWLLGLAICVGLVAVSEAFLDRAISTFSHDHIGRNGVFFAMQYPPNILSPLAVIGAVVLGLVWLFAGPPPRWGRVLFTGSVALIVAIAVKEQLKFAFGHTWPETFVNNNPSWIDNGVYGFFFFHGGAGYASFPSGHSTVMACVGSVLACAYPRLRWLAVVLQLIVVMGLLGEDYHFLGDIIAGTFLGAAIGIAASAISGLLPAPR